jgi:hypothetical protein
MSDDSKKRMFELCERYEKLKDEMRQVKEELNVVMQKLGLNTYHQDPQTGIVYKIEIPKGTYVEFQQIAYKRTAKPGERGGNVLAKSEAESMGFVLVR